MIKALALVCLSSIAPADCNKDTATAVTQLVSADPITVAGCAMLSAHVMAITAITTKGRYVRVICEERPDRED